MDAAAQQLALLLDLDARHDDLLRRLDDLDQRVAHALAEYQSLSTDGGGSHPSGGVLRYGLGSSEGEDNSSLSEGVPELTTLPLRPGKGAEKKCE